MPRLSLDDTDQAILKLLVKDARLSASEIGRRVGLSPAAAKRRIDRLEQLGVVTGYTATVDYAKLGGLIEAFVELRFDGSTKVDDIDRTFLDVPEVVEAFTTAGDPDALCPDSGSGPRSPQTGDRQDPAHRAGNRHQDPHRSRRRLASGPRRRRAPAPLFVDGVRAEIRRSGQSPVDVLRKWIIVGQQPQQPGVAKHARAHDVSDGERVTGEPGMTGKAAAQRGATGSNASAWMPRPRPGDALGARGR